MTGRKANSLQQQRIQEYSHQNSRLNFKKNYCCPVFLSFMVGVNFSQAIAQDSTLTRNNSSFTETQPLPEVIVTGNIEPNPTENTDSFTTDAPVTAATGLRLTIRETPQSISVVTRERMDQQQLNSLADVLDQTTGIQVTRGGPAIGGYQSIMSRGYIVDSYQIDGVSTPRQAWATELNLGSAALDTAIYDSVTVVRGATGLLNGAGDPSASINLTRKRPTHEFQASAEIGLGRWDQRRAVLDIGGPLNSAKTIRGRLVTAYNESESWIDRYQGEQQIVYGILEANVTERTLLTLAIEHTRHSSNAYEAGFGFPVLYTDRTPTPFTRNQSSLADWGQNDDKKTNVSIAAEHQFNSDWAGKLSYSHTDGTLHYKRGFIDSINSDNTSGRLVMIRDAHKRNVDTFDARLNGKYELFSRKHDLVLGYNLLAYDRKRIPNQFYSITLYNVPVVNGVVQYEQPDWDALAVQNGSSVEQKGKQNGFFVATRLQTTDDLSVIFGGRWSSWRHDSKLLPSGIYLDDRRYSGEFVPYAGIVYNLTDEISFYGSYTGIFNPQYYKDASGNLLDPEEGKNYELGLKGEWFNGLLNASAAIFETRKDNLAVEDTGNYTPDGGTAYVAKDNTKTHGWELETSGEFARGWHLQGGYSRTLSKDSDGNRLKTAIPIHQFKIFTSYAPAGLPHLVLGGGINWQSEIYSTEYDSYGLRDLVTQKSYAIVNLMARYAFNDNLSLTVNLNNAFNKNYRTRPASHDYGAERNLYVTARYQFN